MSPRTKQVKKLKNLFGFISLLMWVGTALVYIFVVFHKISESSQATVISEADAATVEILSETAKNLLLSISTTAIIGILASILIKDKMRTFIWMACVVLGTILFKENGMYVTLGLWLVDEYVINALYKHYKNLLTINKEIDRR